jgi:hypothetical protein
MKTLTIRITEEQYEFLREYAYRKRTTVTDVFRKAIDSIRPSKDEAENIKKSPTTKEQTPYTEESIYPSDVPDEELGSLADLL